MIRYLLDSSALWRILREDALRAHWADVIAVGAVGSCAPQRAEFMRSARDADEFDEMSAMFKDLYPDAAIPKGTWSWVETAQYRLVRRGAHRSLSAVDLMICAIAAQRDLVVLHDDGDFATAGRHLADLRERSVYKAPEPGSP